MKTALSTMFLAAAFVALISLIYFTSLFVYCEPDDARDITATATMVLIVFGLGVCSLAIMQYRRRLQPPVVNESDDIDIVQKQVALDVWYYLRDQIWVSLLIFIGLSLCAWGAYQKATVHRPNRFVDRKLKATLSEEILNPPVPITISGTNSTECRVPWQKLTTESRCNILLFIGPAGVGKGPLARQVRQAFVNEMVRTKAAGGILKFDTFDHKVGVPENKPGSSSGLPKVPSADLASLTSGNLESWAASVLGPKYFNEHNEKVECVTSEDYSAEVRQWMEEQKEEPNGLVLIVDGLDEIDKGTADDFFRLALASAKNVSNDDQKKLTIVFFMRGEVTYFNREAIAKLNSYSHTNDNVALRAHFIKPINVLSDGGMLSPNAIARMDDSFFPIRKKKGKSWSSHEVEAFEKRKEEALLVWKELIMQPSNQSSLVQTLRYVDSANEVAKYLYDNINETDGAYSAEDFDLKHFEKEFFETWWGRAKKHGIPPLQTSNINSYRELIAPMVEELEKTGTGVISDDYQPLLLSGFVDVGADDPIVKPLELSLQFPFLSYILKNPRSLTTKSSK